MAASLPLRAKNNAPEITNAPFIGVGFKHVHFPAIDSLSAAERQNLPVSFFEVHAETYFAEGGARHAELAALRQHYPVSLHGVGLSLAGPDDLNPAHIERLKALIDRYQPFRISEHLAWSQFDDTYYNDLLPIPYNQTTLDLVCRHIDTLQNALGQTIAVENPSGYMQFPETTMTESRFLSEMVERTGCGLLLDLTNLSISGQNLGFDSIAVLADYPFHALQEIHLAGIETRDQMWIDSHAAPVADPALTLLDALFSQNLADFSCPILIEWDNHLPDWSVFVADTKRVAGFISTPKKQAKRA